MSGFADRIDARMAEENARFQESQIDWDEGKYTEEEMDAAIDIMAEIDADEAEQAAIEDAELDAELERQAERAEGYWFGELLD